MPRRPAAPPLVPGPQATPPTGPLVTVTEVAKFLNVSEYWVYLSASRHKIPFYRVGRYLRFDLPALVRWLEAKKPTP